MKTMKKNLLFVFVTLLAALSFCVAQIKSADAEDVSQKIIDNSKATWEAYKTGNVSAIKEYTGEDYASFGLTGPSNLQEDLASITNKSLTIQSYTIDEPKVTMAAKDVAILRYKNDLKGTMQGKPLEPCYVTEVWVKRGDKWKIVSYQETPQ